MPAALSAICVPVNARNKNMNVPINSPRKAAISLRMGLCCLGVDSDGGADDGSWTGKVGFFSVVPWVLLVIKDMRLCLLRTVMAMCY